jgi:hypothetical protein
MMRRERLDREPAHWLRVRENFRVVLFLSVLAGIGVEASAAGIWIGGEELQSLATSGPAWDRLEAVADESSSLPNLADPEERTNVRVLANALVHARTGDAERRARVVQACGDVMGTEQGGRVLALGRNLAAYVIAADLVGLPESQDRQFRSWLRRVRDEKLSGRTLVTTHERRPNNWGTHAGASRVAVALYLNDREDLERAARVFRGWLGDRDAYAGFRFGESWWQADTEHPVAVNPPGAVRRGHPIDGVLPDDQRRAGPFGWPPPHTNYAWGALQGAVAQAVMLERAGYDAFEWGDRALLRAVRWLYQEADYPAKGDDVWISHVINFQYGTSFVASIPARAGKNVGFTDWTHAGRRDAREASGSAQPPDGAGS